MEVSFVSTINLKLYQDYGKKFLEEFANFADKDIKLFLVFEGDYPEEILNIGNNIIILPFLSPRHQNFYRKFSKLKEARGIRIKLIKDNGLKIKAGLDYRYDAIKFSYKPFAIHQCLEYLPSTTTHLVWTDADLRCKQSFSAVDLKEFLPSDDEIMSYLGRIDSYSECGFLGFNMQKHQTTDYINKMIDIYETGEIFSYDQWHDSYIWDQVRMDFEKNHQCTFKNISGDAAEKAHVYKNTNLDKFFDHLKGPLRKVAGQSDDSDYTTPVSGNIIVN